jgi:hypothetical protein
MIKQLLEKLRIIFALLKSKKYFTSIYNGKYWENFHNDDEIEFWFPHLRNLTDFLESKYKRATEQKSGRAEP